MLIPLRKKTVKDKQNEIEIIDGCFIQFKPITHSL